MSKNRFCVVKESLPGRHFVEKNPTLMVVAVALVDAEGRVLLQQRLPGREMAGLWEFPGGKVEPGEKPEIALMREMQEELGIECDEACLSPATFASAELGDQHLLLLLYVCRKWRGIPQPLDASALDWVRPHQMFALPMPPADKPLIGLLDALI
jgi:8-oxo-dGTP diphosphatase